MLVAIASVRAAWRGAKSPRARVKSELGGKPIHELGELLSRNSLPWRHDPMAHGILPPEPQCIGSRILEISDGPADQFDGIVILAVHECRKVRVST